MIENKTITSKIRVALIYTIVVLLAILSLVPLWNTVCISFSESSAISANKVGIWPVDFTTVAYKKIIEDIQFWRTFLNSVVRVIGVLVISLPITLMAAYVLSRDKKVFRGREFCMKLLQISMLFSGGMIPTFIAYRNLGLLNTRWVLILPGVVGSFNIIMIMNFFRSLPTSLEEAAILDGANPLQILTRVFVPCAKPSIATIALFIIVGNWNEFMSGMIYIMQKEKYPLMTYINSLQVDISELAEAGNIDQIKGIVSSGLSSKNLNASKIVVAVIPLLLIYPLLQKYLITGIVMGSVKE